MSELVKKFIELELQIELAEEVLLEAEQVIRNNKRTQTGLVEQMHRDHHVSAQLNLGGYVYKGKFVVMDGSGELDVIPAPEFLSVDLGDD